MSRKQKYEKMSRSQCWAGNSTHVRLQQYRRAHTLSSSCRYTAEKDAHSLPRAANTLAYPSSSHADESCREGCVFAAETHAHILPNFQCLGATFQALRRQICVETDRIFIKADSTDRARFSGLLTLNKRFSTYSLRGQSRSPILPFILPPKKHNHTYTSDSRRQRDANLRRESE